MNFLTKAEEQIMQIIWKLKEATLGDIYKNLPNDKPAYNTVATIVRILEKKGFIAHKKYSRIFVYYPIISKAEYSKNLFQRIFTKYFDKSLKKLLSAFSEDDLSLQEIQQIEQFIEQLKSKKQK